jgi:hypothetical protein
MGPDPSLALLSFASYQTYFTAFAAAYKSNRKLQSIACAAFCGKPIANALQLFPPRQYPSDFTRVMKSAAARPTVRLHAYQRRNKIALRQDRRLALHPLTPAALPVAPVRTILETLHHGCSL